LDAALVQGSRTALADDGRQNGVDLGPRRGEGVTGRSEIRQVAKAIGKRWFVLGKLHG
jgi:hypothetical protein